MKFVLSGKVHRGTEVGGFIVAQLAEGNKKHTSVGTLEVQPH